MPRISVVMSVYDQVAPCILKKAISSILAQTFRDLEFIIIADGELTLEQREILTSAVASDGRVKLLQNENKAGPGHAANCGIVASSGDLIARMDADDISLPERLERQMLFLDTHQDIDLVGTFAYEVDEQERILFLKRLPISPNELPLFLARRDPFIHPTLMFRKRFFDRVGMYNASLPVNVEDTELECRAFCLGVSGANINEFLYMFRIDKNFLSRRRGVAYAIEEARLRWNYIRQSRLPPRNFIYPLLTFLMRMSPEWILRRLYQFAR